MTTKSAEQLVNRMIQLAVSATERVALVVREFAAGRQAKPAVIPAGKVTLRDLAGAPHATVGLSREQKALARQIDEQAVPCHPATR